MVALILSDFDEVAFYSFYGTPLGIRNPWRFFVTSQLMNPKKLFVELTKDTAFDRFLEPPGDILKSVEVGSKWIQNETAMANQFAHAANVLSEAALKSGAPWFFSNPILYLYRHAIELSIKGVLSNPPKTHDLQRLFDAFADDAKSAYGVDPRNGQLAEVVNEFARIDPLATSFRYAKNKHDKPHFNLEHVVDLDELRKRLDPFFTFFLGLGLAKLNSTNGRKSKSET